MIFLLLAAPVYYVERIPDTEIRILGTVGNVRQERSSLVTSSPALVIESETSIETQSDRTVSINVEESKRDVNLDELLNDNSQNRNNRINKDKKSVEKDTRIKKFPRTHKKSLHSTLGEYIVLMVTMGEETVFYDQIALEITLECYYDWCLCKYGEVFGCNVTATTSTASFIYLSSYKKN